MSEQDISANIEFKEYLDSKLEDDSLRSEIKHGSIILNNNHAVNIYPDDLVYLYGTYMVLRENSNNKEDAFEHYIPYSSILKIRFRGEKE